MLPTALEIPLSANYCCSSCGTRATNESFIAASFPTFNDGVEQNTDPHYEFNEIHKCTKCSTIYKTNNCT